MKKVAKILKNTKSTGILKCAKEAEGRLQFPLSIPKVGGIPPDWGRKGPKGGLIKPLNSSHPGCFAGIKASEQRLHLADMTWMLQRPLHWKGPRAQGQ